MEDPQANVEYEHSPQQASLSDGNYYMHEVQEGWGGKGRGNFCHCVFLV